MSFATTTAQQKDQSIERGNIMLVTTLCAVASGPLHPATAQLHHLLISCAGLCCSKREHATRTQVLALCMLSTVYPQASRNSPAVGYRNHARALPDMLFSVIQLVPAGRVPDGNQIMDGQTKQDHNPNLILEPSVARSWQWPTANLRQQRIT
jgi:hypothetical protein